MGRHRTFNSDRFLDKFQGREPLIRGYVGIWDGRLELDGAKLDVPRFKEFLVNGDGDGKDELLEGLYRAYDLCTERGHEDLVAACQEYPDYDPDPTGELQVECLSLKVRTENEEAFNLAYDRNTLWRAERFSLFRGREIKAIADVSAAASRFQQKLAEVFKEDKKSDRVLVRQYQEGPYTNFIVYHEKRTKAELIFKGTHTRPKVYQPTDSEPRNLGHLNHRLSANRGCKNLDGRVTDQDRVGAALICAVNTASGRTATTNRAAAQGRRPGSTQRASVQ
jgi:hypothetical protein